MKIEKTKTTIVTLQLNDNELYLFKAAVGCDASISDMVKQNEKLNDQDREILRDLLGTIFHELND